MDTPKEELGDLQGAIQDYNKAIELDPDVAPSLYSTMGRAKIELGQKEEGCLDLSKAGEKGYFEAYDLIKKLCN